MNQAHYHRILKAPDSSFFLCGVRGVGKSTWVWRPYVSARRVDLPDEALHRELLADLEAVSGLPGRPSWKPRAIAACYH